MRKISLLCLLLILLTLVLSGCSQDPATVNEPTETAPSEAEPTATSADTAAENTDTADDEESEEDLVAAVEEVDFCIECHADQTMLTRTAAPEVEVESESEGEG
jgi:PBP1b-binding outer membrane lipoprotein LpoB